MKRKAVKQIVNHVSDVMRGIDYIGVGCVFFCHDGQGNILLNKRSNKCRDEIGKWDPGGGALEFGEAPEDTVRREIKEEYCCDVVEMQFGGVRNVLREHNGSKTHWIAFVYAVQVAPEQVAIGDAEKIEEIGWFTLNRLPDPLHSQFHQSLDVIKRLFETH